MINYSKPMLIKSNSNFEVVFAKKSGHTDMGNHKSDGTGNIFGPSNGNNDKHKFN